MKVIIAGDRNFEDYEYFTKKCLYLLRHFNREDIEVVSGGARGTDRMGERFSQDCGMKLKVFPADWEKYGKRAGPIRNRQMAEYADCLIAFLAEGSRGTKNMIETATKLGLKIRVINI